MACWRGKDCSGPATCLKSPTLFQNDCLSELDQVLEYNASKYRFLWKETVNDIQNFIENRISAINEQQVIICWRDFVMAESWPETLSREIVFHIHSLNGRHVSYSEFSCMVEGPFSRLIFLSLATEEADKAFTKSFVLRCFCVNIQAVADFWVIVHDLQSCLAFR